MPGFGARLLFRTQCSVLSWLANTSGAWDAGDNDAAYMQSNHHKGH